MADDPIRGTRALAFLLMVTGILASASCYRLTATSIGSIVKDASRYNGETVTVWGTVKERIDLPQLKCYVLDDGTGTIAVSTTGPLPTVGEKVHTRGRVEQAFAIGSRKIVGVIEPPRPKPTPMRRPPHGAIPPN
ncbi:MAG: hypothetical protein B7Z68_07790 [Acidobacteria bacterium 21-70-11]|nr:MAG: hypothetical protein B7Z68_07790 [Acidobacteria bacterium 21-70-11]OYW05094.1 MAG: hypothetical protein B7Z61_07430 [Acidobacteria bacterium 37-71-11]HQT94827.1 hypothetical protein [Thermoanaerobaculaceae bacterium]HQU34226.1 hypothetical protein [Thermoanaerobaculaceae bacterium]